MSDEEVKEWEWTNILSHQILSLEKVLRLDADRGQAIIVVNLSRTGETDAR